MENIFPFLQQFFPAPIKPVTAAVKTPKHEQAQGWLRASGELSVEKSLPVSIPGRIYLPTLSRKSLLTSRITRIGLENIYNKKLRNNISVSVIVNDTTTAVSSQLVAFDGAQNGMQRQFLKMKMSKLME